MRFSQKPPKINKNSLKTRGSLFLIRTVVLLVFSQQTAEFVFRCVGLLRFFFFLQRCLLLLVFLSFFRGFLLENAKTREKQAKSQYFIGQNDELFFLMLNILRFFFRGFLRNLAFLQRSALNFVDFFELLNAFAFLFLHIFVLVASFCRTEGVRLHNFRDFFLFFAVFSSICVFLYKFIKKFIIFKKFLILRVKP